MHSLECETGREALLQPNMPSKSRHRILTPLQFSHKNHPNLVCIWLNSFPFQQYNANS
jgi:hypothetical protein